MNAHTPPHGTTETSGLVPSADKGTRATAPPLRSKLFVPGNKPSWMTKALEFEADALVLDLEDAVPDAEKRKARDDVAEFISQNGHRKPLFVRINPLETSKALADLRAIVRSGLTGIEVPKVQTSVEIATLDYVLGWLEEDAGLPLGSTLVCPILETAQGIRSAYEIAAASTRTAYMGGLGVKGGDVERAIGYRWSADGWETQALRARALVDVRAAGVPNPMTGLWGTVSDLDGLRRFALQGRDLGYEGMVAIHPSHIATINEVFTPSEEELEYYRGLLTEMERAERAATSATMYRGEMVDTAMVLTARAKLAAAGWEW